MKIKKQLLKSLKNKELKKINQKLEIYGYHLEKNLIKPQVASDLLIKVNHTLKNKNQLNLKVCQKEIVRI